MREMKVLILQGSPRKHGNTKQFSAPFTDELQKSGVEVSEVWLYDKEIKPCRACKACQNREGEFGCVLEDDMHELFARTSAADLIVFATPIYAFFATAPVKAYMDRLIYGSGKYYGTKKLPPLTRGKKCAILATCGYPPGTAVTMFEDAMKGVCKHIGMEYLGSAAARDYGGDAVFLTSEKEETARAFARTLSSKFK
jgi:multimeric flavodoxin WrbA